MTESSFERFRRQMDLMQFETLPLFSKPYFSWNLKTDYVGRRLVYRPTVESTMDEARRMLQRFRLSEGALVLAESQTAGRGRAGRSWVSPPDVNLYFTLVMLPEARSLLRDLAHITPLATALALEETAASRGVDLHAGLKWPNDVQLHGRKVAGTLIEATEASDGSPVALVGVGINVNLDVSAYPEIASLATSLREAAGCAIPRELVLAAFCNHFEDLYEQARSGSRGPFQAWRERLITLGQRVVANGSGPQVRGKAVDVTEDGALVIETDDGHLARVEAGDVSLSH